MNRYRSYGQGDDQPQIAGDQAFLGVNEYDVPQNLQPGEVQKAVNIDFKTQAGATRGGFVCLPELGAQSFGQKWTYHPIAASTASFSNIAYGNSYFIAIGGASVVYRTQDGVTWSAGGTTNLHAGGPIAFGNSVFIAGSPFLSLGSFCLARSSDGITWTNPTINSQIGVYSIAYGNGRWVAVGDTDQMSYSERTSAVSTDNGLTWTSTVHSSFGYGTFRHVFYANGSFIAADTSSIWKSTDGVTWTQLSSISDLITGFSFGNQKFVALGFYGSIYVSEDAISWTKVRNDDLDQWLSVVFGNGFFTAFSNSADGQDVLYSLDGTNWIPVSGTPLYSWLNAAYGDGLWIAVGASGASMVSENAGGSIYGSGLYSDPNNPGNIYMMLVGYDKVGFFAPGRTSKSISLGAGNYVTQQSTIVQANNEVYLFRGESQTPLYWDGNWNGTFAVVPNTTLPASFESIPNSKQATYYQDRLWVINGKDEIAASDVLEFQDYDPAANEITTNTGNSDYLVATFPFGSNSLIAFKNKSIYLVQNVSASLVDVANTEITRQVGLIGINAVCSVGPDLAYASYGNINLLTLTSTNNAVQHKTLPLSARIRKIMDRVNWEVGYKISMGYWNNKLYVALPLDNSIYCNGVVVYNFITQTWYGEWNFAESMNMCIQGFQVMDYLGLQRLHAITEDGRIFVTDEGQNDISGTTVAEISSELVTRAYMVQNLNHFQRRMFMDIGTNRPNFTVTVYTDGASEENTLITGQTYSRSESWKFNDSAYDLTNVNDDYNRAYRKDYSSGPLAAGSTSGLPTTGLQPQSGFQPEMLQEQRLPLITRRQGRLSWIKVQNTQGLLSMRTLGYETRPGQRSNLTQV
jgi:hypothetical protein